MWKRTLLTVLILLVTGCSDRESAPMGSVSTTVPATTEASRGGQASTRGTNPQERMVIKTADVTIESDDPEASSASAQAFAAAAGGFVVQSNTHQWNQNANTVSLTLRIPAAQFEPIMAQARGLGSVKSENIAGQDVTEEFADLQAQMSNQRALEQRFRELLGQTQSVTEALEVERELARVRIEIDQLEGRAKFLSDQVALSTINLNINPSATLSGSTTTIRGEVSDAFADSGKIVAVVIGGIIRTGAALLPIMLILLLAAFSVRAALRRRKPTSK